ERRGDGERDVVVRDPHQLADLVLPVLPEPKGDRKQDNCADEERKPGPAPRPPGFPVGEGTPDRRGPHAQPVPDGRGDATDHALDEATAREERGRERKARENDRTPGAGQRDVEQLAWFPGFPRWLTVLSRHHGRRGGRRSRGGGGCGGRRRRRGRRGSGGRRGFGGRRSRSGRGQLAGFDRIGGTLGRRIWILLRRRAGRWHRNVPRHGCHLLL